MQNSLPKSIVFITGAFISHTCWDEWIVYFENQGYTCLAPAWPYKYAAAEDLRNRPVVDPIAINNIASVTEYFAAVINSLPEKPILVGHAVGGLIVQLLLQRQIGAAGVALHSFPPAGVNRFRFSFLKAVWETMMLLTSNRQTYLVSFRKWKYVIANGLTCEQQKELYYKYVIPESKKIIRDIFKCRTTINFRKSHQPLLFTSGSHDKLISPQLNYSNYKKYTTDSSVTEYRKFKNQPHLVFGHPGWKKEADFILYWLQEINK